MINISFDNPLVLLVIIPLLLAVIVPHLIAIRKTNRSKSTTVSLIIHIILSVIVTLALAGMKNTTVMTKTEVYVVADLSYSTDASVDKIDGYIRDIEDKLPSNSEYGVVAFGKDYALHTALGGEYTTLRDSTVDDSATNIAEALEYTSTLFSDDVIKRIVLITDGRDSAADGSARLVRAFESLFSKDIYVDAVYIDSNTADDVSEVQLEGVDVSLGAYLNHESSATVLIRSSRSERATLKLTRNGEIVHTSVVDLIAGYNIESVSLPTDAEGVFDYEVTIESPTDYSDKNNAYTFTQTISGKLRLLALATDVDDVKAMLSLYGENASLDIYLINDTLKKKDTAESLFGTSPNFENANIYLNNKNVPCTPEELCLYDEILLVNTDVRDINNFTAFVSGLEVAVSKFGKSLVTIGDNKIQNKTDDVLVSLENMLPAKYGNSDRDAKLYAITIDISLSMINNNRFESAKAAACQLVELMLPTDKVAVYAFYGSTEFVVHPADYASNKAEICEKINGLVAKNGTAIGAALQQTYLRIKDVDAVEKQVYLICDGIKGGFESYNATSVASNMRADGIGVSTINIQNEDTSAISLLKSVATAGGGQYYYVDSYDNVKEIILAEVADDITESVIKERVEIDVIREHDLVLDGVYTLPSIGGFVYAKVENSANTVLTVDHVRASGGVTTSVLYSYWGYGKGRVASYNSGISGDFAEGFIDSEEAIIFLKNIVISNMPKERVDYPYSITTDYDGSRLDITVTPAILNPDAILTAEIITPSGASIKETLVFDTSKYFYSFSGVQSGRYTVIISYSYADKSFSSETYFNVPYSPEYDRFETYSPSPILRALAERGILSTDGIPTLVNNEDEIGTYVIRFAIPFMIAAAALYVIDVIIRKLKWADIVSIFRKQGKRYTK